MKDRLLTGHDLYFVIQEEHRGEQAKQAFISRDVIEQMIQKCQFKMNKVTIELSNKLASTEILLCLGTEGAFPISRFPRSLLQDEDASQSKKFRSGMSPNFHSSQLFSTRRNSPGPCRTF